MGFIGAVKDVTYLTNNIIFVEFVNRNEERNICTSNSQISILEIICLLQWKSIQKLFPLLFESKWQYKSRKSARIKLGITKIVDTQPQ